MMNVRRMMITAGVLLTGTGAGLVLALVPGAARASETPANGPAAPDLAAVARAATGPQATAMAERFFVHLDQRAAGTPIATAARQDISAAAAAKAVRTMGEPVAVHSLNPAFVSGASGDPVDGITYYAIEADSATGQQATMRLTRAGGGFGIQGVAQGIDELRFTRAAKGAPVFVEPQLNAWYTVVDGRVLPLNDDARRSVGEHGATVADYQRLVHGRYGDKLPGSEYVRRGLLG